MPPRSKFADGRAFEFSSGGEYHPEGYGEWRFKLGPTRTLFLEQRIKGRTAFKAEFVITEEEDEQTWHLIEGARLLSLAAPTRALLPDEPIYDFAIARREERHGVKVLPHGGEMAVAPLVEKIKRLIEKYSGKEAVLH